MPKLRVYVLGAGCSFDEQHGYPLAKQFIPELRAYAHRIADAPDCQKIKRAVEFTAALLNACQTGACHAATIDQLVNLILNGRCDGQIRALSSPQPNNVALRYDAVRKAKIATSACFLERERRVLNQQLGKYRDFIQRKVLNETGVSELCQNRLRKSTARVLSFNYDRLFELSFLASFADSHLKQYFPYHSEALNSGLDPRGNTIEILKDRFCFIKLHGSIGMLSGDDMFEQTTRYIGDLANWEELKVTDALCFQEPQPGRTRADPMIVFPYEKNFIVSGRENQLSFRSYIQNVWSHATYLLQEATEIWITGYSFDPTDCEYLIKRLRQAKKCERIIVQNLPEECNRIISLLQVDYAIKTPIEKCARAF